MPDSQDDLQTAFYWSAALATSRRTCCDCLTAISKKVEPLGWLIHVDDSTPKIGVSLVEVDGTRPSSARLYSFDLITSGNTLRGGGEISKSNGKEIEILMAAISINMGFDLVNLEGEPYKPDFVECEGTARQLAEALDFVKAKIDWTVAKPKRNFWL